MVLDIIMAVIILFAMITGYRKGFVYTFLHMASWLLSVVLAFAWSPKVKALLLERTEFYESIHTMLLTRFADTVNIDRITLALPSILKGTLESLLTQTADAAADSVSNLIFNIISFLIVIFAVKFLFYLLIALFSKKNHDDARGVIDGILGSLVGFVKGVLFLFVLLAFMIPLIGLADPKLLALINGWLDSSYFAGTLYDNNILVLVIRDFSL